MDLDPSHYFDTTTSPPEDPQGTTSQSVPLSALHVTLPTLPRPSLSPASTRVSYTQSQSQQSQQKSGRMSTGLDLSRNWGGENQVKSGGNDQLEDDVARARAERAARRNLVSNESDSPSSPTTSDSRDTASARENIMNLVSSGQQQSQAGGNSSSGAPPSLAMFMGSGQNGRRIHRVNQGMTEREKEETERLEKEMELTRAKWGNKANDATEESSRGGGGMSLANLMNRQVGGGSSSSSLGTKSVDDTPKRSSPSTHEAETTRSQTAPPPSSIFAPMVSSPATPSSDQPRSLASAFGSTASGPRLNSNSTTPVDDSEGPLHARSGGGFAMPGLAREHSQPGVKSVLDREAQVSELKIFSRPAPSSPSPQSVVEPPQSPSKFPFPSSSSSPSDSPSKSTTANNATLTRLRGSSIVAERLKFAEQLSQNASSPVSSPTKERSTPLSSPEKRRTVLDRWNRDASSSPTKSTSLPPPPLKSPGFAGSVSPWTSSKGDTSRSQTLAPNEPSSENLPATSPSSYSKPSWDHAPIGAKTYSHTTSRPEEGEVPERKYSKGVALPGMETKSSRSTTSSQPPPPLASPTKQQSEPVSTGRGGGGGVRAAAMRWGRTDSTSQREKAEELARLKESYGVKVSNGDREKFNLNATEPKTKGIEKPKESIRKPLTETPRTTTTSFVRSPSPQRPPLSKTPTSSSDSLVDRIVALAIAPSSSPHLVGEIVSLDVFHLNSPTDDPHPIEHNHLFHLTEILGVVVRTEESMSSEIKTFVWIWRGSSAQETLKTKERIARLEKKTGVTAVEVKYREEPRALVEAFEGQLTICRGLREDFDHLARRLFIVQDCEGVIFVEETDLTARSLCSGTCAVFSLPGEVYAWLGDGSNTLEREACCQFAESIADGRSLTVLAEGEETAWFWHSLDDTEGVEYASAHYWRRRSESPSTSLVSIRSSPTRLSTVSTTEISLLAAGSLENVIIVPESAKSNKSDIKTAIEVARVLASKWEERGFESKTPTHVLVFPSLIPRDLPFLSRSVDFSILNNGSSLRKMNIYTLVEAEEELL